MSIPPAYHESLPYIDPEPSSPSLKAAHLLIEQELSNAPPKNPPPASFPPPQFSETIQAELDRVASKTPLPPLDLSRYEAQDTPSEETSREDLHAILSRSYTSHTYLASRLQNLELLDKYGKNAWLVGNYEMEEELKTLEKDLAETKREIDLVNLARKQRQEEVKAEMDGLEETWKKGVGRVLETEVAVEELRREIREQMRRQGSGPS